MAIWVIRAGSTGERARMMLDEGLIALAWEDLPDLSRTATRTDLEVAYQAAYPDAGLHRRTNHVAQLNAFVHNAELGDLVVLPRNTSNQFAIGEIIGPYVFRTDLGPQMIHTRAVRWLKVDIPRSHFRQDLINSFGSIMAFSRVARNNAEDRIRASASQQPPFSGKII